MLKNLNGGAVISYGAALPTPSATFDGTVFYKTEGGDIGLYIFGFNQDANPAQVGEQVTQGWFRVQTPGLYVSKTGDTMSGKLTVGAGVSAAQGVPGEAGVPLTDSANVGYSFGPDGDTGLFGRGVGAAGSTVSVYINSQERFRVDAIAAYVNGVVVWNAGNDGAGSGLDADLLDGLNSDFFTNASNLTSGNLPVARLPFTPVEQGGGPGQGANKINIGWNGAAGLLLNIDATNYGTTWPININGSSASTNYANSAGTAATATDATSARFVRLGGAPNGPNMAFTYAGQAGQPAWLWGTNDGANSFVWNPSSFNVNYAASAGSVPWTGVTGRPALFYDFGNNPGSPTPTPPNFPAGSISGFDAYSSADLGNFQVGLTIMGGGGGVHGLQIIANWNDDGAAPTGLRFRTNDDNGDTNSWSPLRTIWDQGNLTNLSQLNNDAGYLSSASLANYATKNSPNAFTADNSFTSTNNTAFTGASSTLQPTAASASVGATISFHRPGVSGINMGLDSDNIFRIGGWTAPTSLFQVDMSGNLTMSGNVTAYSDARLKSDIENIPNALFKVKQLNGVTFTRKEDGVRGTGVIAQELRNVLPEAVMENSDGMLSVAYGNTVGLLIEAIKELEAQLRETRTELAKLKAGA